MHFLARLGAPLPSSASREPNGGQRTGGAMLRIWALTPGPVRNSFSLLADNLCGIIRTDVRRAGTAVLVGLTGESVSSLPASSLGEQLVELRRVIDRLEFGFSRRLARTRAARALRCAAKEV